MTRVKVSLSHLRQIKLGISKSIELLINCINPTGETWKVIVEEDRYGNKPVLRFSRDDRSYVLTLNGDGTGLY